MELPESSELYRAPNACPPSLLDLRNISDEMKLKCSTEELETFQEKIKETLSTSYQFVAVTPGPSLPVKYPRTPGYRPRGEENKYNAWYYKTEIKGSTTGKLAGKRIGIKDNIALAGVPMMNGSKMLEGYVPEFDATVVTRILDAGGTIVGKTHCEDMCFDGSSFTNATGPILNPYDISRTAGGSSSGNAVLLYTHEIDMAVGGDQGGSARIPCSWTGTVGLKPTFGLVPYTGAVPIETTVDHLGPMTRTVKDCALLLEVIAGYDEGRDPRQSPDITVPSYSKQLTGNIKGKRIGMVREGFDPCEEDVKEVVRKSAARLENTGAVVKEVSIPMHKHGADIWSPVCLEGAYNCMIRGNGSGYHWKGFYPLSMQESLCCHYNTRPYDFSVTTKYMIMFGEYMRQNYQNKFYAKGQNLSILLTEAYNKALEDYDVLLMPTLPFKAPKLPGKASTTKEKLNLGFGMIANTAAYDVTGHPTLTVNAGFSEGLPIGMMIVGRHFDEMSIFQVAHAFENLSS